MSHEIRKDIILKLIHTPTASFNELCGDMESNKCSYHLNKLLDEGVIEKSADGYHLTADGRSLATNIEGDTGNSVRFPTPIVMIAARDENGLLLAQQRLKEPYFGYWGLPAGKMNFGWDPQERAARDLKEETGLEAEDFRFCAIEYIKTYEGEQLLHHHVMYVFEATGISGQLAPDTHKAHNEWMCVEEYREKQRFPGDWIFDWLDSKNFFIIRGELYMEDGKFVGSKTVSVDEYETLP